jgi:phthalate 4,5-dioxygenase
VPHRPRNANGHHDALLVAEHTPPPPTFHFTQVAPERVLILRSLSSANWAQGVEGVVDSAHSNFLHKNGIRPSKDVVTTIRGGEGFARRPSDDSRPRTEVEDMPYRFRYAAIRKPIVDAETKKYIRISHFIAPIFVMFPPPQGWVWMQAFTPVDDEHTIFWNFQVHDTPISAEQRAALFERTRMRPGVDLDEQLRPGGNRDNRWLQDRAAMRRGDSHTGPFNVGREDFAVQESMGPILDRSKEHLGVSDTAVIRFRRLMLDAVRRFEAGEALPGLGEPIDLGHLRSEEEMLPIDSDWHAIGKSASVPV